MQILDFQKPDEVVMINDEANVGSFEFRPLEPGYGLTVGNAVRRVLLSSLEGYAITSIKIKGVDHEFSTIKGVVQDVTEIILNLKQIRFKQQIDNIDEESATIVVKNQETITGVDIANGLSNFQVLNPDFLICELQKKVEFEMTFTISKGRGYVYFPKIEKSEYSNQSLHKLVNGYFEGSFQNLVSFFVKNNNVDLNEIEDLLNQVNKKK